MPRYSLFQKVSNVSSLILLYGANLEAYQGIGKLTADAAVISVRRVHFVFANEYRGDIFKWLVIKSGGSD